MFVIFFIYFFLTSLDKFDLIYFNLLFNIFFIIYVVFSFRTRKIHLPYILTTVFFFLFVFILIASFLSLDKEESIQKIFSYLSLFYIFIFFFNEKKLGKQFFEKTIKIFSPMFVSINLFVILASKLKFVSVLNFFRDIRTRNLIISWSFNSNHHNHLGDFLGLTLLYFLIEYSQTRQKINWLFFFFYFIFFLFSYSRTAYFSFFTTVILYFLIFFPFKNLSQKGKIAVLSSLGLTFIFIFASSFVRNPYFYSFNISTFIINYFFSNRPIYISQAILAIKEKPFFGWGLGSFGFASRRFVDVYENWTASAHNLFLELLVEAGLPAIFLFLILILLILRSISKTKTVYSLYFIYLLLNFQTDYTYKIPLLLTIFFLTAALTYEEKKVLHPTFSFRFFSLLICFFALRLFLSYLFLDFNQTEISKHFFPFNKAAYQKKIEDDFHTGKNYYHSLYDYLSLYPENPTTITFAAEFCQKIGNKACALRLKEQFISLYRFLDTSMIRDIYQLKKEVASEKEAADFLKEVYQTYQQRLGKIKFKSAYQDILNSLCQRELITSCGIIYRDKPLPFTQEQTSSEMPCQAVYHFNNYGFHNLSNHKTFKEENTFRIIVLGGPEAFGFLVDTQDNWVEKLTQKLNKNKPFKEFSKYEILNLAYHSYDLGSDLERFKLEGKEFNPDLVIWFNHNFFQVNNFFYPYLEKAKVELETSIKKTDEQYFPVWQIAYQKYEKSVPREKIISYQKEIIEEFFKLYQGPLIYLSFFEIPSELQEALKREYSSILIIENLNRKPYLFFKGIKILNHKGHQELADQIYNYLIKKYNDNFLIKNF